MVLALQHPAKLLRPVALRAPLPMGRVVLRGTEPISDGFFEQLCSETDLLEFERSAEGDLIITLPAGYKSPRAGALLLAQLLAWAARFGGFVQDSSAGYMLTDVLLLSPDVSWLTAEQERALELLEEEPAHYRICPFFVIEVRSKSQSWNEQHGKMLDWMEHGCQVGLLVDWIDKRVALFRADEDTQVFQRPSTLEVDAERMPGLVLDLDAVWRLTRG